MKLTEWHNRITSYIPHAEVVRPPSQSDGMNHKLDGSTHRPERGPKRSVVDVWLGYGRYTVEAIATEIEGEIERVCCDVIPRDKRKSGPKHKTRIYESTGATEETLQQMLFAILAFEAEQHA